MQNGEDIIFLGLYIIIIVYSVFIVILKNLHSFSIYFPKNYVFRMHKVDGKGGVRWATRVILCNERHTLFCHKIFMLQTGKTCMNVGLMSRVLSCKTCVREVHTLFCYKIFMLQIQEKFAWMKDSWEGFFHANLVC